MISPVQSGTLSGIEARGVQVEVSPIRGLPGFDVVGLPEAAVRESRVRVQAALMNAGYALPEQRFVVNLAPADLRKTGSAFDLAIAIALLAQCGMCAPNKLAETLIIGELSLDGHLRPVRGLLPQLRGAQARGLAAAIVPDGDSAWSELVAGMEVRCAAHLREVVAFLGAEGQLALPPRLGAPTDDDGADLCDVRGQHGAKRALEIAAAGNHNLLMIGPPGAGKSMLAQRLPGLLPPLASDEILDVSMIHSLSGTLPEGGLLSHRPFRDPHHSASVPSIVGGGARAKPGEISLAHLGVLFLDELPEFQRGALEALRQPLETGNVSVSRVNAHVNYPARFQLVAAMNPCRCGYLDDPAQACSRAPKCARDYQAKISGPLYDRIDLHVDVAAVSPMDLTLPPPAESSVDVAARVQVARDIQRTRYAGIDDAAGIRTNAEVDGKLLEQVATPDAGGKELLASALERMHLSARGYHRVLRVARTLADLEGCNQVGRIHVAEALSFRRIMPGTSLSALA